MDFSKLKIGILHSLIGKNDGVSIVIDQSIEAMIKHMNISLGNIHTLAAHAPARFNSTLDEILWHKNDENTYILKHFSEKHPSDLEPFIYANACYAKRIIEKFINDNNLDIFIVHNGCHPSNFVYASAVGMLFDEYRKSGRKTPLYLLWWHDSHLERERFGKPNKVIKNYLKYIPGNNVDAIVFINSEQEKIARGYYTKDTSAYSEDFFNKKTITIPNTCDIPWDWQSRVLLDDTHSIAPALAPYNKHFFRDIGLLKELEKRGHNIESAVLLLQHTRIVQRKRIDTAIELAFSLEKKFKELNKCIVILVSGHSGDEHDTYKDDLQQFFNNKIKENKELEQNIILLFAEQFILPEREVVVDRKYYRFRDIPGIIAHYSGLGTYFSEVEGFGNNLLEMMSMGLPVVINKYPIFKTDIEHLNFQLPAVENCTLTDETINQCFELLTNINKRNDVVSHNIKVLIKKLNHKVVAKKLSVLFNNLFSELQS